MPKRKIVIGHPDHGRGGKTGHQSLETQARGDKAAKEREKQQKREEKRKQKFSVRSEREINSIILGAQKDLIPTANKAKQTIELRLKQGGINKEKYAISMLSIDEFVINEIKKRFKENPVIGEHVDGVNWDNFRWLESNDRGRLFLILIGK